MKYWNPNSSETMTFSCFKKEYFAELQEEWANGDAWYMHILPDWFIEKEYLDYAKKYDLKAWLRYKFEKFREEKTGLKFIQ